jgi:hypothetical protein
LPLIFFHRHHEPILTKYYDRILTPWERRKAQPMRWKPLASHTVVRRPTHSFCALAEQRQDSFSSRRRKPCGRVWTIHIGLRLGLPWYVVYLGLCFTLGLTRSNHQVASKRMVRTKTKGKIVFVSSVLGYFGMIGYSSYSPGKHAIRGKLYTNSVPKHFVSC